MSVKFRDIVKSKKKKKKKIVGKTSNLVEIGQQSRTLYVKT
jgi:hypothetical protein